MAASPHPIGSESWLRSDGMSEHPNVGGYETGVPSFVPDWWRNGAPDRIRTCGLCLRRMTPSQSCNISSRQRKKKPYEPAHPYSLDATTVAFAFTYTLAASFRLGMPIQRAEASDGKGSRLGSATRVACAKPAAPSEEIASKTLRRMREGPLHQGEERNSSRSPLPRGRQHSLKRRRLERSVRQFLRLFATRETSRARMFSPAS